MTTFSLKLPVYHGPGSHITYGKHPKMRLRSASGKYELILPFAPTGGQFGNRAATYQTTQRAGRTSLVERNFLPLATVTYTVFLGTADIQQSVEPLMRRLDTLAYGEEPVLVEFGPTDGGYWNITTLEYDVTQRKFGTNEATRVNVTLGLTRASESVSTGPVSGGVKPPSSGSVGKPVSSHHPSPGHHVIPKARTYKVQRGDTLSGIAAKQLHNAGRWHEIANLNGIRDPRSLQIGRNLRLPT